MKTYTSLFAASLIAILTGCASSGAGLEASNYCPKSYSSSSALLLGGLANLAYEGNRDSIKASLKEQNLTLDEYDFRNEENSVDGFIAYDQEKAILVFAGSEDLKDWKNNAKTWSEPIDDKACGKQMRFHSGFNDAIVPVINDNDAALLSHMAKLQSQGKKIYVTGHSLGGAFATISAYRLETAAKSVKLSGVYTFGQPFTGDDDFQACYNEKLKENTFRFVSDKDIVPKTRVDSSYRHVGNYLFFDEKGSLGTTKPSDYSGDFISFIKSNLLDAHLMGNYLALLEKNKDVNPFSCP